ncbi:MAG: class IV adenylate cyclase [Tissierellia bacterium]|nr:class IV adenylate cyclase [Tissierellia bacterium]
MPEKEVEVKVLGLDTQAIEDRAKKKGAEFLFEEHQVNITIDSQDHPIRHEKGYLRIRLLLEGEDIIHREMTFKAAQSNDGARENLEYTTEIQDEKMMLAILKELGYDKINRGEKLRRSYKFMEGRLDFDTWDKATYPHPYLEIEGKNADHVDQIREALAIPRENLSKKSIGELQKEISKNSIN